MRQTICGGWTPSRPRRPSASGWRPSRRASWLLARPAKTVLRFAVVKNDGWRVCGRTGMGAVLGSKKIKAVVFHGGQKRPFADPEGLKAYAKEKLALYKDHAVTQAYRHKGTPMMVDILNNAGGFPQPVLVAVHQM